MRNTATLAVASGILALGAIALAQSGRAAEPITVGIADIDYIDSSGEPTDQQAVHAERARRFVEALGRDLAAGGKYRIVALDCGKYPCSVSGQTPDDLVAAAKQAGARLLVYGGVHKMSTLVQNMKAGVVDVDADKQVLDRLITFRGDSDEAWNRAEQFLVKQMLEQPLAD